MKSVRDFAWLFCVTLTSFAAQAVETPLYTVVGSDAVVIEINTNTLKPNFDAESLRGIKTIRLMHIVPSLELINLRDQARTHMVEYTEDEPVNPTDPIYNIIPFAKSEGSVDLGMDTVPVLDQGPHGTCVTFAATAALDAHLQKGDYIDQQCVLALARGLNQNYWDGASSPSQILSLLRQYGIVPKGECFNFQYPVKEHIVHKDAYLYASKHDHVAHTHANNPIFGANIEAVKRTLKEGRRVLIGTLLEPSTTGGMDITVEGVRNKGGLWTCQGPGNTDLCPRDSRFGHEVVIIGYDDKQQLFKIRNSWGDQVGDHGDYYMTYKFFVAMVVDYTIM